MPGEDGIENPGGPPGPFTIDGLLRPEAFPHPVESLALHETHISWVVLTGPFAYKIKKPVTLSFLDASTLERRRIFCEEELRLNRRLAAGLYIDVVPITWNGRHFVIDGDGKPLEYAVRMRQFPASAELSSLLARAAVDARQIAALGERLAGFHGRAERAAGRGAREYTDRMLGAVLDTLADLATLPVPAGSAAELERIAGWMHMQVRRLDGAFVARERDGFIRDGHGDLHAGNIVCLDGQLVPFDCIEFDPGLRRIDVMSDLAFLVMDLASRGRRDLALVLLDRYLEVAGDYAGLDLLRFYAVYRALVRAKVDAFSARAMPGMASDHAERFRRRLHAATQWMEPAVPTLILMHGVSGSGKSWLSERLVPALPALRLRSDVERKRLARLAGQPASAAVGEGLYAGAMNDRTYTRLADAAAHALAAGLDVIVDAAFLRRTDRERFREIARRSGSGFAIVACRADPDELARRIEQRRRAGGDPSDATVEVLRAQLASAEPLATAEWPDVIAADTRDPDVVVTVGARMADRRAGLRKP